MPRSAPKPHAEPNLLTAPPDLETAIEQLVTLGIKDPAEIVQRLHIDHGDDWLRQQVAFYADDVAADIARRVIRGQARGLELALRPGDTRIVAEMNTAAMWVPGPDGFSVRKRYADCTADDFRARQAFYERLAGGAIQGALWCGEVADLIDQHGQTFRDVPAEKIPALPSKPVGLLELVAA